MRIIHLTFSLENGGKENMLVDIANEQSKAAHIVTIIIINNLSDNVVFNKISPSVKTIYLNRGNRISGLIAIIKLFAFLKFRLHPDVIHCHDIYLGRQLKFITRCKIVTTIHGLGLPVDQFRYFDRIFCISDTVKEDIESRSSYKGLTVYNGIYPEQISKRMGTICSETIKLIQVGNLLHEFKGQDVLINAINILVNKNGVKNIQLDLVGEGTSRDLFEQMITEFKLESYIHLLGSKSRDWVYKNLSFYDVFIHASRNEGFGLTVAEAMAAKLPVIASDNDGPAEVLDNGKYGLLFRTEDAIDLASKIMEIIFSYEKREIFDVIEKAYGHCLENFDIRTTAARYLNNY